MALKLCCDQRRPATALAGGNFECVVSATLSCPSFHVLRERYFSPGFQFCSSVIGVGASSSTVLIRKRPSGVTSYAAILPATADDARGKQPTGAPGSSVDP